MRKIIVYLMAFYFAISFSSAYSQAEMRVFEKEGNIFSSDSSGKTLQLTAEGRDQNPVIHPNGKWVYFVRIPEAEQRWKKSHFEYPAGDNSAWEYELWRIDLDGENPFMIFKNTNAPINHPSGAWYAAIGNVQFSPKGDKVYFEASEWVTSAALYAMNPDGTDIKKLGAGNETKIILSTMDSEKDYAGYIVTNQHRYWVFGGSYDWYWLYDPEWQEVGPIGHDLSVATKLQGIKFTDRSETK